MARRLLLLLIGAVGAGPAAAGEEARLAVGDAEPIAVTVLLERHGGTEIPIPADPAHGGQPRRYLAVPLAPLARAAGVTPDATLLARASDGYVSQIPGRLALAEHPGQPRGWIAIERPGETWPNLPGKGFSAAPFYIVWEQPTEERVISRYWVYRLASLTAARTPAERWPQLRVQAALPADAPERRGEALFVTACLTCHRFAGAGEAEIGPDLARPMNPVQYWKREPLLRFIRDPASIKPGSRMPATSPATLSDADIDLVVRYLEHQAAR